MGHSLNALRKLLRAQRDEMHHAFAMLSKLGLASVEDLQRYKGILKVGAADHVRTRESVLEATRLYRTATEWYRERLAGREPEDPGGKARNADSPSVREGTVADETGEAAQLGISMPADLAAVPRADGEHQDLVDEARERLLNEKRDVVRLMSRGYSGAEAVEMLGLDRSDRWARRVYERWKKNGDASFEDKRRYNGRARSVLTDDVCLTILGTAGWKRGAGNTQVAEEVIGRLEAEGRSVPSKSSIIRFLEALPPAVESLLRGREKEYDQNHREVLRVELGLWPNQRYQADHKQLPVWVRAKGRGGTDRAEPVWLTYVKDSYSRAPVGWFLSSADPDSWSIAMAVRHAILPKPGHPEYPFGVPETLQVDNGPDFASEYLKGVASRVHFEMEYDWKEYPDLKGKIENDFRVADMQCVSLLTGYKRAIGVSIEAATKRVADLPTLPEVKAAYERWVHKRLHTIHRTTGRRPIEMWHEVGDHLRTVPSHILDPLLLFDGVPRQMGNDGLEFMLRKGGGFYHSDNELVYKGRRLVVRYNPDDLSTILLYDAGNGEALGEAWRTGDHREEERAKVKRRRQRYRREAQGFLAAYVERIRATDRPKAEAKREVEELKEEGRTLAEMKDQALRSGVDEVIREYDALRGQSARARRKSRRNA